MKPYFSALILMGGEGRRLGSSLPKQFHPLGPLKIYQHTLQTFRKSALFAEIILVCHPDWVEVVQEETAEVKIVSGGPTRQASSWKGLQACDAKCQYVMIHDAVRPFVSVEILQKNYEAVLRYSAVDTCISSADTLLTTQDGVSIESIPSRSQFRRGQTPQTFSYPLISEAHQKTSLTNATDDCQLVIDLGMPVALVAGSDSNIKITTDWDLEMAQFLMQSIPHKVLTGTERTPLFS